MIELPYGRIPITIDDPPNLKAVVLPNDLPPLGDYPAELRRVLDNPSGARPLKELAQDAKTVAVIISDPARDMPKKETFEIIREYLPQPDSAVTILIANGKHAPLPPERMKLGDEILGRYRLINHQAGELKECRKIGNTPTLVREFFFAYAKENIRLSLKGAPAYFGRLLANLFTLRIKELRRMIGLGIIGKLLFAFLAARKKMVYINKAVADADLVVTIGQIKPHYFAGFSGGAKSILPGVSSTVTIAPNHFMKTHPLARLGIIEGNVTREDMEAAARLLPNLFIVNIVTDSLGKPVKVVAGDVVKAHREGVEVAKKITFVPAPRADIVIASDRFPVAMNIYQTTKTVAPAAMCVKPGGVIICVTECPEGVGGALVINEVIYELGLKRYLPENVDIYLVSGLTEKDVTTTFCRYAATLEEALECAYKKVGKNGEVVVLPRATFTVPQFN